jgi:hypothetical protein
MYVNAHNPFFMYNDMHFLQALWEMCTVADVCIYSVAFNICHSVYVINVYEMYLYL